MGREQEVVMDPPTFTPEEVDAMKRRELQRLCKHLGIKANTKNVQMKAELKEYYASHQAQHGSGEMSQKEDEAEAERFQAAKGTAETTNAQSASKAQNQGSGASGMDTATDHVERKHSSADNSSGAHDSVGACEGTDGYQQQQQQVAASLDSKLPSSEQTHGCSVSSNPAANEGARANSMDVGEDEENAPPSHTTAKGGRQWGEDAGTPQQENSGVTPPSPTSTAQALPPGSPRTPARQILRRETHSGTPRSARKTWKESPVVSSLRKLPHVVDGTTPQDSPLSKAPPKPRWSASDEGNADAADDAQPENLRASIMDDLQRIMQHKRTTTPGRVQCRESSRHGRTGAALGATTTERARGQTTTKMQKRFDRLHRGIRAETLDEEFARKQRRRQELCREHNRWDRLSKPTTSATKGTKRRGRSKNAQEAAPTTAATTAGTRTRGRTASRNNATGSHLVRHNRTEAPKEGQPTKVPGVGRQAVKRRTRRHERVGEHQWKKEKQKMR